MAAKPRVLVLGGCGVVGRNLVHYLVQNDLCTYIRVVDKVLPGTAYLSAAHKASFESPNVEYMQGNLVNDASIAKIYTSDSPFDVVFNLAAETKYGQVVSVYKEKVLDLAVKCANEAVKRGVGRFVEVSTAQVYSPDKSAATETSKAKPWTHIATFSLQKEAALKEIAGLNVIFVRPACCYGPGDINGISPRIICGAVYKKKGEKMEFLWTKDLKLNTVHLRDVAKALWFVTTHGEKHAIYNLCDKADTTQGSINVILERVFGIKTGFKGSALSHIAKLALADATAHINEEHLKPWSDLCAESGIVNTPLTPYLDMELLSNNHLSVDGSAIEALGFTYDHPEPNEALIREQIEYFTAQNIFPTSVLT